MQTIQFLVLATAIATLIAGLNVSQVAHAQSKGTCGVSATNPAGNNPTTNTVNGNPHCFDPEQQPTTATSPAPGPDGTSATGSGACAAGTTQCNHPQSTNPQGKIVGNPHEETASAIGSGCSGSTLSCHQNPQGSVVGNPHYPSR